MLRVGILAAMPQEIQKLKENVQEQEVHKRGSVFEFTTGKLEGKPVVFGAANVRLSTCALRWTSRASNARA